MATIINLNDTVPAAPSGGVNVHWQADPIPTDATIPRNVSAYISTGAVLPNFADDEVPSGTVNGTNAVFTLAHTPNPASSLILLNSEGRRMAPGGIDFTLSGATITYVTAAVPQTTDRDPKHIAYYRY